MVKKSAAICAKVKYEPMASFTPASLWSFKTNIIIITLLPLTVCQADFLSVVFYALSNSGLQHLGGFTRLLIQLCLPQVVIRLLAFRILAAKAIS